MQDALDIAEREMKRLGLFATHQIAALYAGVDRRTEGAAYALVMRARSAPRRRVKLLIHADGHASIHRSRSSRAE